MKKLTVYKKLEQKLMIGPFTIREAILVIAFTFLTYIGLAAADYYLVKVGLIYQLIIPSTFLATATSAKVYLQARGIDILEYILARKYPKSLEGGTFETKA